MQRILYTLCGVLVLLGLALVVPELAVLAFLLLLIAVIGGILGVGNQPGAGDPTDVNPNLVNMDVGDVVVLSGYWVYDSLHGGYNEIHPVMKCQIIGRLGDGDWQPGEGNWSSFKYVDSSTQAEFGLGTPEEVVAFRDFWCGAFKDAKIAEEGGSRKDSANDWDLHPSIDGCRPPPIIL